MMQSVVASLYSLSSEASQSVKVRLSEWLRDSVTAATTDSDYGPHNPFKEKDVVDAFWYVSSLG